jgi:hypothetical protein
MRAIGLQDLKLAFERAGTVLPAAEPPAPEAPVERAHRIIEPDPPRCQWGPKTRTVNYCSRAERKMNIKR